MISFDKETQASASVASRPLSYDVDPRETGGNDATLANGLPSRQGVVQISHAGRSGFSRPSV